MRSMARRKPNTDELYGIRRVQRENCLGWSVELHRNGEIFRKTFTVFRFGTDEKALTAAQAWHDGVALTARPTSLAEYASLRRRNNTSGYPGEYHVRVVKVGIHGEARVHLRPLQDCRCCTSILNRPCPWCVKARCRLKYDIPKGVGAIYSIGLPLESKRIAGSIFLSLRLNLRN
jgi:hypothetical protein